MDICKHVIIIISILLMTDLSVFICSFVFVTYSNSAFLTCFEEKHSFAHSFSFACSVSHLDAILGPLLQVRNDGVVPEVNEP